MCACVLFITPGFEKENGLRPYLWFPIFGTDKIDFLKIAQSTSKGRGL